MMYYPEQVESTGQWVVRFEGRTMGPARTKEAAFKLSAVMNGGDMELVQNLDWEYFLGGDVQPSQVTAPLVVDLANDNPPQL
jgi:hypothetical protein